MRVLFFLLITIFCTSAFPNNEIPAKPIRLGLQFLKHDNKIFIALNFENVPNWHTYWKNPGDAGLSIKNIFKIDGKEIKFQEEEWPSPKRFIQPGNLWGYGYEGSYSIFFRISKSELVKYNGKAIELNTSWLACKNVCIPGQLISQFVLTTENLTTNTAELLPNYDQNILKQRFESLPKLEKIPNYLNIKLSKGSKPNSLILSYRSVGSFDLNVFKESNFMYIYPQTPFDIKHETFSMSDKTLNGTTELIWDGEYSNPPQDFPKNGKFIKPITLRFLVFDPVIKTYVIIEKKFSNFDLMEMDLIDQPKIDQIKESKTVMPIERGGGGLTFYYLMMAFLGGLILNVMPCVLPVISIKLFGLVKYRNESHKKILKHNFFYTLGIVTTFLILASVVLFLKSIGTQVGWGFQLQSPYFISFMIVCLFIFSLNLFGIFELSTPGGSKIGNVIPSEGFIGDFFSGILATILSTPCSAPFLGTALTFAFTSSTIQIYLIFTMIGLGLAFPFILTAIYPRLVIFLPKPGAWMIKIKKVLGVILLLTLFWLFDIYNALVNGQAHVLKLSFCLMFIFIGFLFFRKKLKWISSLSFILATVLLVNISLTEIKESTLGNTSLIIEKQSKGLDWQIWSEAKMEEHKLKQELVFIDFTAKWCISCKVNEKLVLETNEFKNLVKENDFKLLIGDWTKRDEVIGSFLKKNGLVGVPAYFIQKRDGTLINLGEVVTISKIKANLN